MKWQLPKPRSFGWKMKNLQSAKTTFNLLTYGSFECLIEHDIIKGCSPQMIEWWFRNIGGEMEYQGQSYPKYLVWHPYDHIFWRLVKKALDGTVEKGAYFQIVEAFAHNMDWLVDPVEEVVKLDHTGIRLRKKILGEELYSLEHKFYVVPDGTRYVSRMQIGSETVAGRYIFNPIIHRYIIGEQMAKAWFKHNIEEVGNFEFFLPDLYQKEVLSKEVTI